ncbi:isopentenyl transferase family protein [Amycolatopsis sp. Hca4]|uniref:isopentenyl transferase family protein n=1 Tax=Amycolatopsis sp. Hca4 TaxID=2742131 RepID=UPI00159108A7|nr:isopentenyl transferase family protein [Amycolatopsis sp. Hca4]QKV73827.1 isopentenyl transferase [Amycolatopsis sp. Hca4]
MHAIVGATGTGKSAHAIRTARRLGTPVVVADRIQCFVDLRVTSARDEDEVDGVCRWFLGDRTVADGDYPADAACRTLCYLLGRLTAEHPSIVLEGGSVSLLTALVDRHGELPFELSFEHLRTPEARAYWRRLRERARRMLRPPGGGRGIIEELASAWRLPEHRNFVTSVNGLEAIVDWCARHDVDPGSLAGPDLEAAVHEELAEAIAWRHAAHGWEQERMLTVLLAGRC